MKRIYRIFIGVGLAVLTLASVTSCIEETEPTTVATTKQIAESSSASEALLMALPAYFNTYDDAIVDRGWHYPFGYGANMYIRDLMTGDMTHSTTNYASHFYYWAQNKYQGDGYVFCQYVFNYYYGFVLAANNLIGGIDASTATDTQLGYLGAGLAFRALLYLDMARSYEFLPNDKTSNINADGNDVTGLTVPIVTDTMSMEQAKNNPRATHQQMFDFILGDLNNAEQYITHLTDYSDNVLPDLACVYGLKARLYMWNEDYPNAERYARLAINNARVDPMTEDECTNTTTGFNDISKWMWGSQQTSEDNTVQSGIINWTSWLSNQTSFGYTGYAMSNMPCNLIDKNMYDRISDTDFRKLEFKAPEGSELADKVKVLPEMLRANDDGAVPWTDYIPELASVKFRPNQGNGSDYQIGAASAYPIMRVEEMYFIEAEAAAHQDASRGKQLVESFMKTYRDPNYTCSASSTDDVVEEIVFQKRVELWGEGQTFFDIKRLNYSVTRGYPGTNWYSLVRLNTNGRPAWMNFVLIRTEANNNQGVVGMNNPDPSDLYTPWTSSEN